jgi:hypothetical protein
LQSQRIGIRGRLCGILDSGDLVACPWAQAPVAMALSIVDSGTGTVRQTVPVAMTGFLTSVERYGEGQIHELETVMVSGGTVAIRLHPYSDQGGIPVPGDVLLVDVRTGVVTGKVSLPVQVPRWVPHGGGMLFMASEGRRLQASQPEGIVLVHVMPRDDPTDHFAVSVVAVEVVNPGTGYRSEVMTVDPGVTKLVVRGAVR